MKKETIIIFGAHSDDEILAAGGTIKKYSLEGKKIISVTFHTGGASLPWLKEELVIKERIKETRKIHKMVGVSKTIHLEVPEFRRKKESEKNEAIKKVRDLIEEYKSQKLYTYQLLPSVHYNARLTAGKLNSKFAECFEKIQ